MTLRRFALVLAVLALCTVPARAGSFGIYGSYWNSDEAGDSWGGGARVGFDFVKVLEFEFHGTYYPDFKSSLTSQDIEIKATPLDGGLRFNILPTAAVNPYFGAGVTYYFLDSDQGQMDNETGIYGLAGLDFGSKHTRFFVEAIWRKLDTTISLSSFDVDAQLDGWAGNAGFNWRWGK
jgi:hypothetical protein